MTAIAYVEFDKIIPYVVPLQGVLMSDIRRLRTTGVPRHDPDVVKMSEQVETLRAMFACYHRGHREFYVDVNLLSRIYDYEARVVEGKQADFLAFWRTQYDGGKIVPEAVLRMLEEADA